MYEQGISGMRFSISDTAEYGDLTRGPQPIEKIGADLRSMMTFLKKRGRGSQPAAAAQAAPSDL
jgi:ketol-acid reductoisomerase